MVDIAVVKAQALIIVDALNIILADEETRSPHHPLRVFDAMFNLPDGKTWAVRDGYIDAVYAGRFPTRKNQLEGTVQQYNKALGNGEILEDTGNASQRALMQFFGDYAPTNTVSFDYQVDGGAVVPVSVVLTGSGNYAALAGALAQAIGATTPLVLASSNGGLVYITVVPPATEIVISNLTVV